MQVEFASSMQRVVKIGSPGGKSNLTHSTKLKWNCVFIVDCKICQWDLR